MNPGQIIISKSGRDKGLAMVVMSVDGEYVYLADGALRPLSKLKKKKAKHIQPTKDVVSLVPPDGRDLQDADIRKALAAFRES